MRCYSVVQLSIGCEILLEVPDVILTQVPDAVVYLT